MNFIKKHSGISLLEALISIAVLALVTTILVSAFGSFRASQGLSEAHSSVIGMIKDARARTSASSLNSNYGVHFEVDKTVLFKGNAYNPIDPSNEIYILPQFVEINSINLTGGAVDAIFTRLNGTTTASGTISLRSKNSVATYVITLESTGVVK